MRADYEAQIHAATASPRPATPAGSPGVVRAGAGAVAAKKRPSAAALARESAARREAVGVGRLAWENPVFGIGAHYRKYRLLNPAHGAQLDELFYRLTGTTPERP